MEGLPDAGLRAERARREDIRDESTTHRAGLLRVGAMLAAALIHLMVSARVGGSDRAR
jgi:hypothetical protein